MRWVCHSFRLTFGNTSKTLYAFLRKLRETFDSILMLIQKLGFLAFAIFSISRILKLLKIRLINVFVS